MRGIAGIKGTLTPLVGQDAYYEVSKTYPGTAISSPEDIKWKVYREDDNGAWTELKGVVKTGKKVKFNFPQKWYGKKLLIEAYLVSPEKKSPPGLIVKPIMGAKKIKTIEIRDANGNALTQSPQYGQSVTARITTENMLGDTLKLSLWERDTLISEDHDTKNNQKLWSGSVKVSDSKGVATLKILLSPAMMALSNKSMFEGGSHEYYMVVQANNTPSKYSSETLVANKNQDIVLSPNAPKSTPPKTAASKVTVQQPAANKPVEGPGFWEQMVIKVKNFLKPDEMPVLGKTVTTVKAEKIKFDKVKEFGEEAVIYITSVIATEIKVDKAGKLVSYPDMASYNGQSEYKEGDKIYCKKISDTQSAYPTFKAYIYRGNVVGEAVKKLKQDIENKTFENAEATVLELARHAMSNNKNYGSNGPLPPNSLTNLYELKYQYGVSKERVSYRYRIVENRNKNKGNFPSSDNEKSGTMAIGSRGSISLDPWKSKALLGCVGIKGTGGGYHPSCADRIKDANSIEKYRFIYHSLNNYLETVIPEMTGIFGRRLYTSGGEVAVAASTYDHQTKVFVLVDPLPEIDACKCDLKKDGRKEFYESFGEKTVKYMEKKGKSNKFKGLYMVSQRRQENGFKIGTPGNNPMNIKGSGDAGKVKLDTHETINGKYISMPDDFANFSSEDAGFQGYLDLLDTNFPDASAALFDNSKSVKDFVEGLQRTGKKGVYATGKAIPGFTASQQYEEAVKNMFKGVVSDYNKILECKLCKAKTQEEKDKINKDIQLLKELK